LSGRAKSKVRKGGGFRGEDEETTSFVDMKGGDIKGDNTEGDGLNSSPLFAFSCSTAPFYCSDSEVH
jgi:hypothetical protein